MLDLLEMMTTKADVKWTSIGDNYAGFFTLDGVNYSVYLDVVKGPNGEKVVDVGFKTGGSQELIGGKAPVAKILGSVINALKDKIKELNPDIVLVMVSKSDSGVDKRKSLYTKLVHYVDKFFDYKHRTDWIESSGVWVMFISKTPIHPEQLDSIVKKIQAK